MKTENKKTALRGTVLFTVVAVMALLIIFLTSTLALASASGNRAHKSYASAQASYTARAAIDSFAQSMTRSEEITAIVQNLGSDPSADAIHPKVELGDLSLGQIGYYNASGTWVPDRIEIAPLGTTSYAFYDVQGNGNEWGKVDGVRITVTCRVGKEEETVSAYIRKAAITASGNGGSGEVKGLQEAGGNNFRNGTNVYGGLGVGLSDTDPSVFHYHNASDINTSLNFFNAHVNGETSSLKIHVRKPTDSSIMPYSETVITGSYMTPNDTFIYLDYSIGANEKLDVKNTPYLYINELLTNPKGVATNTELIAVGSGNKQADSVAPPFNVFAGTIYMPETALNMQADLYLMDEYDPSAPKYKALFYDRDNNVVENWSRYGAKDPNTGDYSGVIVRGDNVIGGNGDTSKTLYKWVGSVINKNEVGFESVGGSIYCNGNLTLHMTKVHGDLRVMGNLTCGNGVVVDGNLVVQGTINGSPTVHGTIYNGSGGSGGLKDGVVHHIDELLPGYTEVVNIKFENNEVPNVVEGADSEGNATFTILDSEGSGEVYSSKPYYRIKADGTEDITDITTNQFSIYESIKIGDEVVVVLDGDGNAILTDDEVTYYDEFNTKVDKSVAVSNSFYTDEHGNLIDEGDAFNPIAPGETPSYDTFVAISKQEAYPQSMTREKIYGEHTGLGFQQADEKTKIITTLKEAREALNMDPVDGSFNTSVYLNAVPGGDPPAWDGSNTITGSCTIKNTTINDNITIDTSSEIWIVLENCTLAGDKTITVKEDLTGKHGTVNFLIRGDVKLGQRARIITNSVSDNCNISYQKDFGIIYYSELYANSPGGGKVFPTLTIGAGGMICGSVKAPTLVLRASQKGNWTIKYTSEYSSTPENKNPNILGNALIDHVEKDPNEGDLSNFAVIYTKSGAGGSVSGGGAVVATTLGYFDIGYLAGA